VPHESFTSACEPKYTASIHKTNYSYELNVRKATVNQYLNRMYNEPKIKYFMKRD